MTFTDIENLFEYLKIHFEYNPKVNSKREKNAWFELLAPFDPKAVKEAMLQCLREKEFFPHAQEVASKCKQIAPDKPESSPRSQPNNASIEEFHATYRRLKEEGKI